MSNPAGTRATPMIRHKKGSPSSTPEPPPAPHTNAIFMGCAIL
jgi:hypothetical protein